MIGVFLIIFHAQRINRRDEFCRPIAVGQTASHPFDDFGVILAKDDVLIDVDQFLHLGGFFHRSGMDAAGHCHLHARYDGLVRQIFDRPVQPLLLRNCIATHIKFCESIAGNHIDPLVARSNHADVDCVGGNKLAVVDDPFLLERFPRILMRILRQRSGQFVEQTDLIAQFHDRAGAGMRRITGMAGNPLDFDVVIGAAFALGHDSPTRASRIHNHRDIGLRRQFSDDRFRRG